MTVTNDEVASRLEEYADLLDAQGDDHRPRSYRRAAENIREYPVGVEELVAEGEDAVREIEGVGESIAGKVIEYVETGTIERLEEARTEMPIDMAAITRVEGVGPRRAGDFYRELGVTNLDELEAAAREGRIRELPGYGEKSEGNIAEGIEFARQAGERYLLGEAMPVGESILAHLSASPVVERCDLAGSLRRWCATIGDVDVLAAGDDPVSIVERLVAWEGVDEVIESGPTKTSVRAEGTRVDLRVVAPEEWGAALQYFTGSKAHNVRLRNRAIARDLKVNEYGVFDISAVDPDEDAPRAGERIAGESEEEVYAALDLEWMPPELREDRGEMDAAADGTLPDLVEEGDVRGDLHVHTTWSDGHNSIEEMVAGATAFGHDYVAISDHARGPGVVSGMGLDDDDLLTQVDAVREVAADAEIEVFAGVEANVDVDGDVSVADEVLSELDFVIASPHSGLDGDGTDRLISAIEHPHVDAIGHPSGRLLNKRAG
ncbi:MAG TPA: PHP domain-containing protein, partial [Halobacteriales archaeon]|nr:PHP domain-containing protein [Halobacteriales archaeon]